MKSGLPGDWRLLERLGMLYIGRKLTNGQTDMSNAVIDYSPEAMASFPVYCYEWIDNLDFVVPPDRYLADATAHCNAARKAFLEAGWDGDGEIGLLWLPPFAIPSTDQWDGVILWHVKQLENGTSWLLSPVELPFENWCRYL